MDDPVAKLYVRLFGEPVFSFTSDIYDKNGSSNGGVKDTISTASSSETIGLPHMSARRVYAAHRSHHKYRNDSPLWLEYSNGTHYHYGATEFLEAAGLQTSMKHYKFGRTLKRNMSDSISDKCGQPPCDQPVFNQAKAVCEANGQTPLHNQWPYAPHARVLQYKVLLKVGKQNRGELESMLKRIKLPMHPN